MAQRLSSKNRRFVLLLAQTYLPRPLPLTQVHARNPYKARGKELKRLLPQGGSMWSYSPQAREFRRDDDGALAAQLLLDHWKVGR